ncbi:quinol monooxygenase YgiN [Nakamurella sp. UYEF19]|uniref:putative quinol monooxygenase n=1 Tax=Nakamurella sp. UYEF19 TaxID=1756392 RepID=UPI00339606A9
MFALVVRFTLLPNEIAAFDELVRATVERIRLDEPDTLTYSVHQRPERPHERVFYEVYTDRAAFEYHEAQPHTRKFLAQRPALLAEEPEVWWLT